jgi:hypothetical protein
LSKHLEPWDWADVEPPRSLSKWGLAPGTPGFYELGLIENGRFEPKYGGRARVRLSERLCQHYLRSHNPEVRKQAGKLWYRCKALVTSEEATFAEAMHIAAFEYPWNRRNEWKGQWALED